MSNVAVKSLGDGRVMINLGCGTRTHPQWNNLDFSWIGRLRRHAALAAALRRMGLISDSRWDRMQTMDPDIIIHDLRNSLPFPDRTFDVVYHSHVLEHFPREDAPRFMAECHRVLKPGGVLRVVVPDLEEILRQYHRALAALDEAPGEAADSDHELSTEILFEQMVRGEGAGTRLQRPVVRFVERIVRGDAGRIGELHRWMYDRHSLSRLMMQAGFRDIVRREPGSSGVEGWRDFFLDTGSDGSMHKPGSLYMEGRRAL